MTDRLRVFVTIGIVLYFLLLSLLVKKKHISLRYALVWGVLGLVFLALDVFPGLLVQICDFFGIQTPVFALFAVFFTLVFFVLIVFTGVVSRQAEKIRTLVQTAALLEKRIMNMEQD
ncbi:MAG: DUF2304 domain-containing protein [Clostridiales bacterium]|nr:DUF2304 domain-containing protein [Clostridiales bacterium]